MMDETALEELMIGFARSRLTPSQYFDESTVKVFKAVTFDVDGDGEDETCFAAGFAGHFAPGICALLDPSPAGPRFVDLVPHQAGFRELVVADLDKDGHAEILTTWFPSFNGDGLALAIFRYDGSEAVKVFPDDLFYEGFVESKDLDADGVDELVIWRSAWKRNRGHAAPYQVLVYQGTPAGYRLASTHETASRYHHWSIAKRDVGIMGMPTGAEHRRTSVAERRRQFAALRASGQVTDDFVEELRDQASVLAKETFLEDALGVFDIAAEANHLLLPAPKARQQAVLLSCGRAATALRLGDHEAAVEAYRHAVAGADEEALTGLSGHFLAHLHRELGLAQALMGDYENALASQAAAFALLEGVTAADTDGLTALSLLHSNAGLTWNWIGDEQQAIEHFQAARDLDDQRGNLVQRAYDETGIANVRRLAGRLDEAVPWYKTALRSLADASERDQESEANLGLGLALLEAGQASQGLEHLRTALLLTTVQNLHMQDWKHYLYLGEAYRRLGQFGMAEAAFRKASSGGGRSATSEIRWQALYGLGQVRRDTGQPGEARDFLEQAIEAVERFHRQYLPESQKISMLAAKANPYEALVDLLTRRDRQQEAPGLAAAAFGYAEQAKSRVFLERLAISRIRWPESAPADLAGEEARLIDELRALSLRDSAGPAQASAPAGIDRLEARLDDVWTRIEASGPDGAEYVSLRRGLPLAYEGIRDLLQ